MPIKNIDQSRFVIKNESGEYLGVIDGGYFWVPEFKTSVKLFANFEDAANLLAVTFYNNKDHGYVIEVVRMVSEPISDDWKAKQDLIWDLRNGK